MRLLSFNLDNELLFERDRSLHQNHYVQSVIEIKHLQQRMVDSLLNLGMFP